MTESDEKFEKLRRWRQIDEARERAGELQDKPTAAYIISLIGGILGLVASLILLISAALSFTVVGAISILFGAIGGWCLICSIIVIIAAVELNETPWEHTKWGVLILVFSIIGVGSLLGLIGGILALVYKPQPSAIPPAQVLPTTPEQA